MIMIHIVHFFSGVALLKSEFKESWAIMMMTEHYTIIHKSKAQAKSKIGPGMPNIASENLCVN